MTRFVSLEKSSIDLAAFKRAAMSGFEHAQMSLKRTKETASQMGASPDTIIENALAPRLQEDFHFQVNKSTLQQQIRIA